MATWIHVTGARSSTALEVGGGGGCRARAVAWSPPVAGLPPVAGPLSVARSPPVAGSPAVAGSTGSPTPVLATALMPTMQSHKLFSPRVSFELAFASIAGEPQGYPSVLASKDACWSRRVFHLWAAFGRTNASPQTRGPTPSGTRNFWDPICAFGVSCRNRRIFVGR